VSDATAYDAFPWVELQCHVEGTVRPTKCRIAVDGIASTWLDDRVKAGLRAAFEDEIAAIGARG
jgi:hypothetical protein